MLFETKHFSRQNLCSHRVSSDAADTLDISTTTEITEGNRINVHLLRVGKVNKILNYTIKFLPVTNFDKHGRKKERIKVDSSPST